MPTYKDRDRELPLVVKGLLVAVAILFGVIGLIGLLFPIIPGIVFLVLAAWVLTRVSSRFDDYLHSHHLWQRGKRRWRRINALPLTHRVKLSMLLAARSLVNAAEAGFGFLKRSISN